MRSWLFVPGDSERKLAKAADCGADVLIIDLEDSVAADNKEAARCIACDFLKSAPGGKCRLYIRINALDTGLTDADLEAVLEGAPDGVMLPKTNGGVDVTHLDAKLNAREPMAGLEQGKTHIAVVATETPAAIFGLGSYAAASPRLDAMSWGAEDLSAAIGATASRDEMGRLTAPFELARSLCLFGATAAGVQPVDTVFVNFRDDDGLAAECRAAARDGFTGKLAIHPGQISVINEIFTPSAADIARARAVIAAFEASPGTGVASLDGAMIDRPHLKRAERIIERAKAAGTV